MRTMRKMVLAAGVVALGAMPSLAQAQSRAWTVCGGNTFNTCASVQLEVSGADVTVRVWNLSGATGTGTYAGTVFTGVGFEDVGSAAAIEGSMTMTGPVRGSDSPLAWEIKNNTQIGGGVKLDIVGATDNGVNNAIASGCADSADLPGVNLWQNPCGMPSGSSDPGWVTLQFQITGTWAMSNTYLLVKGQNGPGGQSTECISGGVRLNCGSMDTSVVPEPMTIALLGTGLAGVGGAGIVRRRRRGAAPGA